METVYDIVAVVRVAICSSTLISVQILVNLTH